MIFAEQVKNQLLSLIGEMAAVPWLFSKNPSTDFSRTRKLDFEKERSGEVGYIPYLLDSTENRYLCLLDCGRCLNPSHHRLIIDSRCRSMAVFQKSFNGFFTYQKT